MKLEEDKSGDVFIHSVQMHQQSIIMFFDFQIRAFNFCCKNDIVYIDATGSIIKSDAFLTDFQVYTLLVRNPTRGELSLPLATLLSNSHNHNITIGHFLETFQRHRTELARRAKTPGPKRIVIDGSYVMWNATLWSLHLPI